MADLKRATLPIEERRETTVAARRQWRFKAAEKHIKRIVDGMPPLTEEQREKLALLLRPADHQSAS